MAAVFGPLTEIERIVDETRRLRRGGQHQLEQPGRRRWGDRCGAGGARGVHRRRDAGGPDPGEPRVPHLDRRAGVGAARRDAEASRRPATADPTRRQRDRRLLPADATQRHDARPPRQAGGVAGAVRARDCTPSTTPGRACSSRSARSGRCTASSTTCSASTTTSSRCSPTTPSWATPPRSTRRCAGSGRPGSASTRAEAASTVRRSPPTPQVAPAPTVAPRRPASGARTTGSCSWGSCSPA